VIHCTVLFLCGSAIFSNHPKRKLCFRFTSHQGRAQIKPTCRPRLFESGLSPQAVIRAPHPHAGHRRAKDQRTGRQCRTRRKSPSRRAGTHRAIPKGTAPEKCYFNCQPIKSVQYQ